MKEVCWPYFDPDFDQLRERIYGPNCRVSIDNESLGDCTMVKVDSVKQQGLLLQAVQVLTDMNLTISKGYISSDAGWLMDVFHVKDMRGNKLTDQRAINYIQQAIGTSTSEASKAKAFSTSALYESESSNGENKSVSAGTGTDMDTGMGIVIEMSGTDRPGLFSEISATLAELQCNIVEAHAWSHNARLACVAYISDQSTHTPISHHRLAAIEDHLTTLLRSSSTTASTHDLSCISDGSASGKQEAKTMGLPDGEGGSSTTSVERRLHQLMLSVRDYDRPSRGMSPARMAEAAGRKLANRVLIENCNEKGYSIVTVRCRDRSRLMFDTVCTLTDMQYVVFHASVDSREGYAFQEYFIRHIDGCALNTEGEKDRVIKCLEAAIERRVCEGVRVELCAINRVGLLSDITRVLRENGLAVVRADVATHGDKSAVVNASFYVRDISGNDVDMNFIESMKRQIIKGPKNDNLQLVVRTINDDDKSLMAHAPKRSPSVRIGFSITDIIKSQIERFSQNFVAIR